MESYNITKGYYGGWYAEYKDEGELTWAKTPEKALEKLIKILEEKNEDKKKWEEYKKAWIEMVKEIDKITGKKNYSGTIYARIKEMMGKWEEYTKK